MKLAEQCKSNQQIHSLLSRAKLSSVHAVDALVVATALDLESAIIATADLKDIRKLAGSARKLNIFAL